MRYPRRNQGNAFVVDRRPADFRHHFVRFRIIKPIPKDRSLRITRFNPPRQIACPGAGRDRQFAKPQIGTGRIRLQVKARCVGGTDGAVAVGAIDVEIRPRQCVDAGLRQARFGVSSDKNAPGRVDGTG